MTGSPRFLAFANYGEAFRDPLFWQSLKVTMVYSVVSVPLGLALGLFVAVLMNQKIPGMNVFRTIYYLPSVVSGVAVAILWPLVFNSQWGVLNTALSADRTSGGRSGCSARRGCYPPSSS